jgi:hypothetical protein
MEWLRKIADAGFSNSWVPYVDPSQKIEVDNPNESAELHDLLQRAINLLRASLRIEQPQAIIQRTISMLEQASHSL